MTIFIEFAIGRRTVFALLTLGILLLLGVSLVTALFLADPADMRRVPVAPDFGLDTFQVKGFVQAPVLLLSLRGIRAGGPAFKVAVTQRLSWPLPGGALARSTHPL